MLCWSHFTIDQLEDPPATAQALCEIPMMWIAFEAAAKRINKMNPLTKLDWFSDCMRNGFG